jgi:hypothetical protein
MMATGRVRMDSGKYKFLFYLTNLACTCFTVRAVK